MECKAFFDTETFTMTYVVWDEDSNDAVIIDTVTEYSPADSKYNFGPLKAPCELINKLQLKLHYIIDTHAHADHVSGAQEMKRRYPTAKTLIGREITRVQATFKEIFNLPDSFKSNGSQFDVLVEDGETINAGQIKISAMSTPGHTEACYSFKIDQYLFVGDTLFMPDYGVGRCDFPQGSAEALYRSITQKIFTLPDDTLVMTGHDYMPNGRPYAFQASVLDQKQNNIHVNSGVSEQEFIKLRSDRDKTLKAPRLLLPSIQVNIDGGIWPSPEKNGTSYLKIPVSAGA